MSNTHILWNNVHIHSITERVRERRRPESCALNVQSQQSFYVTFKRISAIAKLFCRNAFLSSRSVVLRTKCNYLQKNNKIFDDYATVEAFGCLFAKIREQSVTRPSNTLTNYRYRKIMRPGCTAAQKNKSHSDSYLLPRSKFLTTDKQGPQKKWERIQMRDTELCKQ